MTHGIVDGIKIDTQEYELPTGLFLLLLYHLKDLISPEFPTGILLAIRDDNEHDLGGSVMVLHVRYTLLQIVYTPTYGIEQWGGCPWHIGFPGELRHLLNGFGLVLYLAVAPDGRMVRAGIKGDRDPGYGSTSKMISECAICLLRDAPDVSAGFWTPGAAMQHKLIKRLVDHGADVRGREVTSRPLVPCHRPARPGDPVRRSLSAQALLSLEYWITRMRG